MLIPEAGESSGEPVPTDATTTTGDDEPPPATTEPTPDPVTTTGPIEPPGTSSSTGSGEAETGQSGCEFLCPDDAGSAWVECNPWLQDCPVGEKCAPWANDGGNSWNATRCVPVDPNPDEPGDPCTVEGSGVTGIDSCDLGVMCWDVDPETNQGTCVPMCTGNESSPVCADPSRTCAINGEGIVNLCLELCDPVAPTPCSDGEGCYPINYGFVCAPDASGDGGGVFEPCEFINGCDAGLVCASPDAVGQCETGSAGCCTPACSLDAADCPEPTVCVPWYDDGNAPPGYEDVGVCVGATE